LPVAIKCHTPEEAHEVYTTLEPIAARLTPIMLPVEAAGCFYKSTSVAHLLKKTVEGFYAVVVGHESGIYLSW
jgi:hypothetical protein